MYYLNVNYFNYSSNITYNHLLLSNQYVLVANIFNNSSRKKFLRTNQHITHLTFAK